MASPQNSTSGIRDNRNYGSVGDYLKEYIQPNSELSFVSAYFTVYAFNQLKDHLKDIDKLRFLFGEPSFLKQIDPEKTDKKSFKIEDDGLSLMNRLSQKRVARECADWIREKAEVRSIKIPNFLHGKLYHIQNDRVENAILGSSNFTVNGLGLGNARNVELNLIVDSDRDRKDLKRWFEDVWESKDIVEDVKEEVLEYLKQIYADYSPEFIYQKTLYHLFEITVDRDAKLQTLKELIIEKVSNPTLTRNDTPNRKAIVFTAFADTATYIYESLRDWAKNDLGINIALVTGTGANRATFGTTYFNEILTNFSPVSKSRAKIPSMRQDEAIDLLIATDCISEGQNLQDCDLVINYDIHWNPVRLIQRFGRIDRLGSINDSVQLINFWATEDLNKYLNLKGRVEARMALVDVSTTSSDNILLPNEIEKLAKDELNYRDKQLLRLKDEILDLEDFNESIALNDFSLDDFRAELSELLEYDRSRLRDAPFGIYAVTPTKDDNPPGVIFCFQQESGIGQADKVNPLQPFYLIYVRNDGVLFYSFVQVKQLLETFRSLCQGNEKPFDELCRQFNQETGDGEDMTFYDELLKKGSSEIKRNFQQRNTGNLFVGRSGILVNFQEDLFESSNFKLITWLVVK